MTEDIKPIIKEFKWENDNYTIRAMAYEIGKLRAELGKVKKCSGSLRPSMTEGKGSDPNLGGNDRGQRQ